MPGAAEAIATPFGPRDTFVVTALRSDFNEPIHTFTLTCSCGLRAEADGGAVMLELLAATDAGELHWVTVRAPGFAPREVSLDRSRPGSLALELEPAARLTVRVLEGGEPLAHSAHVELYTARDERYGRELEQLAPGLFRTACVAGDLVRVRLTPIEIWEEVPPEGGLLEISTGGRRALQTGSVRIVEAATGGPLADLEVRVRVPDKALLGTPGPRYRYERTDAEGRLNGVPKMGRVELLFPDGYAVRAARAAGALDHRVQREVWAQRLEVADARTFVGEDAGGVVELGLPPRVRLRFVPAEGLPAEGSAALQVREHGTGPGGHERWSVVDDWIRFDLDGDTAEFAVQLGLGDGLRGPEIVLGERARRLVVHLPGFAPFIAPWPFALSDGPLDFFVELEPIATAVFDLRGFQGAPTALGVQAEDDGGTLAITSRLQVGSSRVELPSDVDLGRLRWTTTELGSREFELDVRAVPIDADDSRAGSDSNVARSSSLQVAMGALDFQGEGATPWDSAVCHESGGVLPLGVRMPGERVELPAGKYWLGARSKMERLASELTGGWGAPRTETLAGLQSFEVRADEVAGVDVAGWQTVAWEGRVELDSFFPAGLFIDCGFGAQPASLPTIPSERLTRVEPDGSFRIEGLTAPPDWVAACIVRRSASGANFPLWFRPELRAGRPVVRAGWLQLQGELPTEGATLQVSSQDFAHKPTWISNADQLAELLKPGGRLDLPAGNYRVFVAKDMQVFARFENVVIEADRGITLTLDE